MHVVTKGTALLALALSGCAGSLAASGPKIYQADHASPTRSDFAGAEGQWSILSTAFTHAERARNARESGNLDQERQEARLAADGFANYLDKSPTSDWRLVVRRLAAVAYLEAQDARSAAAHAQKMIDDPESTPATKAMGALLAVNAWEAVAMAETRDGKLERLRFLAADQRAGQPLRPRIPAEPWKRLVEASDAYVRYASDDPSLKPGAGGAQAGIAGPGPIALKAAQIEYAFDNMEDARRRFEKVMADDPSNAAIQENAVPLYLQTFLVQGDDEGFEAALKKVGPEVHAQAEKAAQAAKAPGAGAEAAKAAEVFARLDEGLARQKESTGFSAAAKLLQAGRNAEAGAAFEKLATANPKSLDAAAALYNASIGFDRSKDPKKAEALREKLLREYPDAKIAPQTVITQAAALSRRGDHAGAEKLYGDYLARWPGGEQRCVAMQNVGVEAKDAGRKLEAAGHFQAFGTDPKCSTGDPDSAAIQLFYAAEAYRKAGKRAEEKVALQALVALQGVKNVAAQSMVDQGKKRLKGLK